MTLTAFLDKYSLPMFILITSISRHIIIVTRIKALGKKIASNDKEVPANFLDNIGYFLAVILMFQLLISKQFSFNLLFYAVIVIHYQYTKRLFAKKSGLYENGLILIKKLVRWERIHSIKTISTNEVEILFSNGVADNLETRYEVSLLTSVFNQWNLNQAKNTTDN